MVADHDHRVVRIRRDSVILYFVTTCALLFAGDQTYCKEQGKPEMSVSQSERNMTVLVGGTAGIQALADPANTVKLRATGKVGLYIHELGSEVLNTHKLGGKVAEVFAGTGPGVAELGLSPTRQDAVNFFDTPYKELYCKWGLAPAMANVNGLDPTGKTGSLSQWKDFAAVASMSGIKSIAPFVNNNNLAWPDDFDDEFWNYTKQVALEMGACALDTPPDFAFRSAPSYLKNVLQVVQWCRRNDLRTSIVISPNGEQSRFLDSTKRFYAYLLEHQALPTEWVVENFDNPATPLNPENIIGSEDLPNSTTGVALWLAQHAEVAPTPPHVAGLTAPSPRPDAGQVKAASACGDAHAEGAP